MSTYPQNSNSSQVAIFQRIVKAIALAAMLLFSAGTAIFAYAGTFSRYWADDYCYSAVLKQNGFVGGIVEWYKTSGNRFSTLVPVAFSELFGQSAISFIPVFVILLWVAAWVFFLFRLNRLLGGRFVGQWLALLALIEVYFAALLAPDRMQTIYWRMGTLHYTLPLPLLLITLGLIASGFQTQLDTARRISLALLVGVLAFFAAGLSETFAALQAGILGLCLLACVIFLRKKLFGQRAGLLAAGLIGSLLAMIVMVLSPQNAFRQAELPPPDNLLLIIPYSIRYAADFVLYSIRGQIVSFLVYLAAVLLLALLAFAPFQPRLSPKTSVIGAVASLLITYLLIVCSFAPSAYAGLQYPAGRALMPGMFILLAGSGSAAFFAAQWIRGIIPVEPAWRVAFIAVLLLAASFYPLRAIKVQRGDIAQLSVRSARWDARNGEILYDLQRGDQDVQVRQVDVVQGLEDIGPDPAFWVNRCARIFYGLHSIQANP